MHLEGVEDARRESSSEGVCGAVFDDRCRDDEPGFFFEKAEAQGKASFFGDDQHVIDDE